MIQNKKRHRTSLNRVAPTGRQAFKGMIQPLMLAGGSSAVTPQMISNQYIEASIATPSENTQQLDLGKTPCPFSYEEAQACQWNPNLEFCKKRGIEKTSPQCNETDIPECPLTQTLKKICSSSPDNEFAGFCSLKKVNGLCVEEYLNQQDLRKQADEAKVAKKKEEDRIIAEELAKRIAEHDAKRRQAGYEDWIQTRGCTFQRADLTPKMISQMNAKGIPLTTTKTPCPYSQFNNSKVS